MSGVTRPGSTRADHSLPHYVLDAKTGQFIWNTVVGPGGDQGGFEWGTAYDGKRIYVSLTNHHHTPYQLTEDGALSGTTATGGSWAALDPETGRIIWQTADPQTETVPGFVGVGVWDLAPVSSANGIVFAASMAKSGNEMYALDGRTGEILWTFAAGSSVNAAPAIVDGSVYWGAGYARSGVEGSGNTRLYGFSLALPLLASQIAGMGLNEGLSSDLTNRLNRIESKLESSRDACDGLGDFLRKVIDEAAGENPRLSLAQAQTIVAAVSSVEGQIGCADASTSKETAEQELLGLIDLLNGMSLREGVAHHLREDVRDVARQLVEGPVAGACGALADVSETIGEQAAKRNGFTSSQAAQLSAAVAQIAAVLTC